MYLYNIASVHILYGYYIWLSLAKYQACEDFAVQWTGLLVCVILYLSIPIYFQKVRPVTACSAVMPTISRHTSVLVWLWSQRCTAKRIDKIWQDLDPLMDSWISINLFVFPFFHFFQYIVVIDRDWYFCFHDGSTHRRRLWDIQVPFYQSDFPWRIQSHRMCIHRIVESMAATLLH